MKLTNVHIENFRSLKEVSVKSFKNMNMIYGHNNSGKSNFLKFIELVFKRKSQKTIVTVTGLDGKKEMVEQEDPYGWWEGEIRNSLFMYTDNKNDIEINFNVTLEIIHEELKEEVLKELHTDYLKGSHGTAHFNFSGIIRSITSDTSEIILINAELNRKTIFDSTAKEDSVKYFQKTSVSGKLELFNVLLEHFNDCVLFIGNERNLSCEKEAVGTNAKLCANNAKNWLLNKSFDSNGYDRYKKFIKFAQSYFTKPKDAGLGQAVQYWPFSTGELSFGRFGNEIEIMLPNAAGNRLPISNFGTGVQQIYYLLEMLFFCSTQIVLIEEIELNLSPKSQNELFKNLCRLLTEKQIQQVIFTTHSDAFNYRADFQIFEAEINAAGYTTMNPQRAKRKSFFNWKT